MRKLSFLFFVVLLNTLVSAKEYHVSVKGNDSNDGTASNPFKTISFAARLAQPGDIITVHEGTYRERITPPRGGESDKKRIIYQAAPGENVEIKGSEIIKDWVKVQDDVWKVIIPNTFFGKFNPYSDLIRGDWFDNMNRQHHTGAVYLNGDWLSEATSLDHILKPVGTNPLWFGQVDKDNTTIWAHFKGVNPLEQMVEINVRQTVFYPEQPGMNYITLRGFSLRQAATPWAPPTAEQIGLVGTYWSKGWIIENNIISHSRCTGITLGKYGDEWDNKAGSAEGYVGTINRALKNNWNKETIGGHIVRNNIISHCEQSGIVGSMGAVFSTITGNTIHDIHIQQLFSGAEMAGIKFHGAIDVTISWNHIYRTYLGIWLDWMTQGARISGNLCHDNAEFDLMVEANHGPFVVDNNIFMSPKAINNDSQGGAYAHNLIAGGIDLAPAFFDGRQTPFHKAHSTEIVGLHDNPSGDDRYYNNLFVIGGNLNSYDSAKLSVLMNGNVFLKGTRPSGHENEPLLKPDFDPALKLVEKADGFYLEMTFDKGWSTERTRKLVTTEMLGKATIPNLPFEQPDGSPLKIDMDYSGNKRNPGNPYPGPFENPGNGSLRLKVW